MGVGGRGISGGKSSRCNQVVRKKVSHLLGLGDEACGLSGFRQKRRVCTLRKELTNRRRRPIERCDMEWSPTLPVFRVHISSFAQEATKILECGIGLACDMKKGLFGSTRPIAGMLCDVVQIRLPTSE